MTDQPAVTLTIEEALQQAIARQQEGRLQEAEQLYRAILQLHPQHPDAHHNLGVLAVQTGQPDAGLSHFRTAVEADPSREQFWLSYISALIESGQRYVARQVLDQGRGLGLQGDSVEALEARLRQEEGLRSRARKSSTGDLEPPVPPPPLLTRTDWTALLVLALGLVVYHLIYAPFYFSATLGHDHGLILPYLLEGFYWIRNNGILAPYWFSPGLCGGQPAFPDLQNMHYSLPQMLTLILPPIQAVYASVLIFAALGYWGMYLFLGRILALAPGLAVAGAILFLFNGFYASRMMIGHFTFHAFMLLPLIAFWLLRPTSGQRRSELLWGLSSGLAMAYWIHSGMIGVVLPALFALVGLTGLVLIEHSLWSGMYLLRWSVAALFALSLSLSKLLAGTAFLGYFPRVDYTLPAFSSPWELLLAMGRSFFWQPGEVIENYLPHLVNQQWQLGVSNWMYGISLLPLLLLTAWLILRWRQPLAGDVAGERSGPGGGGAAASVPRAVLGWGLFGGMVALPVIATWAPAHWQDFFKTLPVIKSSSELFRWWSTDMVLLLVVSLWLAGSIRQLNLRQGWWVAGAAVVAMGWQTALFDRDYFVKQPYSSANTTAAWHAAHRSGFAPAITACATYMSNGEIAKPIERNELLIQGYSAIHCYNTIFGYNLENFPMKSLKSGDVTQVTEGVFNLKNPACYLYPRENDCQPGDHFTTEQRSALQSFAAYRPFSHHVSTVQKVADWLGWLAVVLAALSLTGLWYYKLDGYLEAKRKFYGTIQ
ncbi:MAG: tetratricopeptide repeat protein [Magnetococcales bacterium]|nr:tetratricopeptide repeat protein [Magnetococcales bacterium]